jgi:hypothetical protein
MLHMARQEFSIEIPDAEADEIHTVQQGLGFCLTYWDYAECLLLA